MNEKERIQLYRELDKECGLLSRALYGENKDDRFYYAIPSKENQEAYKKRRDELEEKIKALETPSLKFVTLKEHFLDFLADLKLNIDGLLDSPAAPFGGMIWGYEDVIRKDRGSAKEKAKKLADMLSQAPEIWKGIQPWIYECSKDSIRSAIRSFTGMAEGLEDYLKRESILEDTDESADAQAQDLIRQSMKDAAEAYTGFAKELEEFLKASAKENEDGQARSVIPDTEKTVKMPKEEYEDMLRCHYGVELETLLSWGEDEVNKTRNACFEIAKKLAAQFNEPAPSTMKQVNDLLLKYAGPCETPKEMLDRANRYLRRTRALAHEYVNLPDDEDCRCVPIPYRIRESYPWGGYEGGDGKKDPIRGQMFLNVYNYKNVTDGWIKINALHESYPGHHVQYVRSLTDPMPETVKIGAKSVALMEGMCLRTEHAFEFIYGEDPWYPLFVAYRRHHTSVRIKVDLMLFYYGTTIEEAVDTYMEELGFDHISARGQVLSQEITPGYFTCYYYGMKKIEDWEKRYGFSKKDYTELLFSAGNISLDNFERILQMDSEERASYLNDFGSLIED